MNAQELCKYCGRDLTGLEIYEMCACSGSISNLKLSEKKKQNIRKGAQIYDFGSEEDKKLIYASKSK